MNLILKLFRFLFPEKKAEFPPLVLTPLPTLPTLAEVYKDYQQSENVGYGDKGSGHSYIPIYDKLLSPYRHNSNVLEIGFATGNSLCMWRDYFIEGNIYGIDKDRKRKLDERVKDKAVNIFYGDATDELCLRSFENIKFDVIIDDASHTLTDQVRSYNLFKNKLNSGGIYIIEDIRNIDRSKETFLKLDKEKSVEIIDLRNEKGRSDDVLVALKDLTKE